MAQPRDRRPGHDRASGGGPMSSISSPLIEAAEEAVRLAQERLAALRAVPATDEHYPVGTVIRWQRDAGSPRVAIKVPTAQWSVTHRSTAMRWDGLVNTDRKSTR